MGIIDSRFITLIAYKEIAAEISVAISFFIKKAKKELYFIYLLYLCTKYIIS